MNLNIPPILITANWEKELELCLESLEYSKLIVLVDKGLKEYHSLKNIGDSADLILEMESSEESKSLDQCVVLWQKLIESEADRKSVLVIFGGGITCDLGGFVAASYKRGIPFIMIPTTLLAMADASVGGKVGVNFEGFKNIIGAFRDSYATIIDPAFLETQSQRHILAGFAEILKHGAIHDADFFESLKKGPESNLNWADILNRSLEIKWFFASQDPTEKGLRKALNFGHSYAHAIESIAMDNSSFNILHGEAVAWGMVFEAVVSQQMGSLSESELNHLAKVIFSLYPAKVPEDVSKSEVWHRIQNDKKNQGGEILFTLLESLGRVKINVPISFDQFSQAWEKYNLIKKSLKPAQET